MGYIQFDKNSIRVSSDLLRALSHDLRLKIFNFIQDAGQVNVNEIYTSLNLEQSITSQHLSVLRNNDIVNTRRDGKMVYYFVNENKAQIIKDALDRFEQKSLIKLSEKQKE
ncbi:MAG: metalloregulator ArsR/SmtB family transcription factor [Chitinophagales bacterium]|nr:metalloregulator ArsR/SmtB family transcription factor [Chitinophagales bacterium]MCZ2394239.1 metalloregulator ArsR/SmtB family transcription factor [Chitinophagales bacterium]